MRVPVIDELKQRVFQAKHEYFSALSEFKGRVLEIGFGKGESLPYYSPDCEVFALEKSAKKIQAQKDKFGKYKKIKFFQGDAENLPFEDNFFDSVTESFVLCSVNSLDIAMREIKRVLKVGGKFILLEHTRSDNKIIGRLQDILAKPYSRIFKNCHPNRNPMVFINNNWFHLYVKKKKQVPYILGKLVFAQAYKKEVIDCERKSS